MSDREIQAVPAKPGAVFKKITLTNKGDYYEVYDGETLVGTIQEQAEMELWKVIVPGSVYDETLYLESRTTAAEYACIIYWYCRGKLWFTDV